MIPTTGEKKKKKKKKKHVSLLCVHFFIKQNLLSRQIAGVWSSWETSHGNANIAYNQKSHKIKTSWNDAFKLWKRKRAGIFLFAIGYMNQKTIRLMLLYVFHSKNLNIFLISIRTNRLKALWYYTLLYKSIFHSILYSNGFHAFPGWWSTILTRLDQENMFAIKLIKDKAYFEYAYVYVVKIAIKR